MRLLSSVRIFSPLEYLWSWTSSLYEGAHLPFKIRRWAHYMRASRLSFHIRHQFCEICVLQIQVRQRVFLEIYSRWVASWKTLQRRGGRSANCERTASGQGTLHIYIFIFVWFRFWLVSIELAVNFEAQNCGEVCWKVYTVYCWRRKRKCRVGWRNRQPWKQINCEVVV